MLWCLYRLTVFLQFLLGFLIPEDSSDFKFPSPPFVDILHSQETYFDHDAAEVTVDLKKEKGMFQLDGVVLISSKDSVLVLRICIVAYCSSAGHRGVRCTQEAVRSRFYWKGVRNDIEKFVKIPLWWIYISRPFGTSLKAQKSNEVIDFDYLKLETSDVGYEHVLVIQDRYSGLFDIFAVKMNSNPSSTRPATEGTKGVGDPRPKGDQAQPAQNSHREATRHWWKNSAPEF
jgi:hypothetical protein